MRSKKIKVLIVPIIILTVLMASSCGKNSVNINVDEPTPSNEKQIEINNGVTEKENVKENKTETPKQEENIQPKPSGKVIVIDPGHASRSNLEKEATAPDSSTMKIKDGGGVEGIVTRTPEYLINMKVAVKLKAYLEKKGYTVIMTKTDNSRSLGNVERASIWNKANPSLVIRIHADSSDSQSIKGASMLVPSALVNDTKAIYKESKRCGSIILNTLISEVGMNNRGLVERADMTGFNWSKVPVVLVEMGFLSNPEEDRLLSSESYEDKIAKALANGIEGAVK